MSSLLAEAKPRPPEPQGMHAVRQEAASPLQQLSGCLAGLAAAAVLAVAQPSLAAGNTRLPPIDKGVCWRPCCC